MTTRTRLAILLALTTLAAGACGGGEQQSTPTTIVSTTAAPAPPDSTSAPAATDLTSTAAPDPTSAPGSTAAPDPTSAPGSTAAPDATISTTAPPVGATVTTTTAGPWMGAHHPLTGLPATSGVSRLPALAVKIGNNDTRSLPQVGLEQADIVYEAHIENNVTRFVAVFHSRVPDKIGLVRSARSSDIDLIGNLNMPYFAYWGSNEGVGAEVREAESSGTFVGRSTSGTGQENFFRDDSRGSSPFNGFLDASRLLRGATGVEPDPVFDYGPLPASAVPAAGVRWSTPGRQIDYVWDYPSSRWLRFQGGVPLLDVDGVQLGADNVLLLYIDYRVSDADRESPQALTTGNGDGWLLREGTVTGVTWGRPFVANAWHLADDDTGEIVMLVPGTTWVALARLGEGKILDASEAAALTG